MRQEFSLLHTDIVDSTAVNSRLGDTEMTALWNLHDRLSRELLAQWRGREVDRSDGFMLLFDDCADAAHFALAYHRLLADLPVPLSARAGIHVGPLTLRENSAADVALGAKRVEVVGIAKAFSARLMALAQGGQTLISPSAQAALTPIAPIAPDPGPPAWRCVSHGHWRMRGLDEPLEVFEIGDAGCAFLPPPDADKTHRVVRRDDRPGGDWVGLRHVPHSLPAERDSFVGRLPELHGLTRQFHEGARLVTVTGTGGMGKTRLALRHAWAWRGLYPGGVWFCDLSAAQALDGVLHAVAQGLDVPLGADPAGQLGRAIAGRGACLVILDNFEQVRRHARDTLGAWLDAAPLARFLVTSREVLGLAGERTLAMEPLAAADGVALFHQRAHAAHAPHTAAAADPAVALRLVELLDGLPLAIELAAPRVRVLPLEELLARMGDRFRLLSAGDGRPDRQSTLHATLAWSWDLLVPAERALLAQLSVFESSFSWTVAQPIVDLSLHELAGHWAIDLLQSLVNKSLLRPLPGARFTLLRSVQDFAAQQLRAEGSFPGSGQAGAQALQRRYSRHYAALSEASATAGHCVELDNLVAACRGAVVAGDAAAAAACLGLAWSALRQTGPFHSAVGLAAEVRALPDLSPEESAMADWVSGAALKAGGDGRAALVATLRGLAALPDCDSAEQAGLIARLHNVSGDALMAAGDVDGAAHHLAQARVMAERSQDPRIRCGVHNLAGALALKRQNMVDARASFQAGLAVAFEAGDLRWQGGLLGNLAGVHYTEGRLDEARQAYEQARDLASDAGDRRWEGNARCNLGLVHRDQGRLAEAETELSLALALAQGLGYAVLAHTTECNLGLLAESRGDLDLAIQRYQSALHAARASGDQGSQAEYQNYLTKAQQAGPAGSGLTPC